MSAVLKCVSCLCCCFIATVNIVAMVIGFILASLGFFFVWGFAILTTYMSGTLSGMLSSITSQMKSSLGVDIDLIDLISNLGQITGSMGAAFLAIGIGMIVIGCIGCCGACCSNKTCLLVYAVIVGLIVLAQTCIVAIWFLNTDLLKQAAKQAMTDSVKKFTGISSKNIQSLVQNIVHILVGCCGVDNGTDFYNLSPDWARTYHYNRSGNYFAYNLTYPLTCCKFNLSSFSPVDEFCSYNNTNTNTSWYQVGCYGKLFDMIDQYFQLDIIFYVLGGIIGVQTLLALGAGVIISRIVSSNKVKPG